MKLPHVDEARVTRDKVTGYLMDPGHFRGRHKASFFARFGFRSAQWQVLAEALRGHAREHEVVAKQDTPFGTRYTIEGRLDTPSGRRPLLRTVWIVERTTTTPRLVTAYPLDERPA